MFGPALAGVLIAAGGMGLVLWLDLASFVVALASVPVVRLREPRETGPQAARVRPRLLAESAEGMRYLFARPSLRGLTLVFFTVNMPMVFGFAVLQPMILARTGGDAGKLAVVMSSGSPRESAGSPAASRSGPGAVRGTASAA